MWMQGCGRHSFYWIIIAWETAHSFGHRGPMHHRRRGLGIIFERHTLQHHQFYRHDAMAAESPDDFQMVLFPPVMLLFFLGGLAAPIGLLLGVLGTPNLGWLFAATGVAYWEGSQNVLVIGPSIVGSPGGEAYVEMTRYSP